MPEPSYPPVGFFYALTTYGKSNIAAPDAGFQEVSGLTRKTDTETIKEGGENRFVHKVPGRVSYENLVLKRGLLVQSSSIGEWCRDQLEGGLKQKIAPKDLSLLLLDQSTQKPLMTWNFVNAYPVSWQVSDLKAQDSSLVIESLQLSYSYFWVEEEK